MLTKPSCSDFLAPQSLAALSSTANGWHCQSDGVDFPLLDGIPFLFPDVKATLSTMRKRAAALVGGYQMVALQMKDNLEKLAPEALSLTRERMILQRQHHIARTQFIDRILSALRSKGGTELVSADWQSEVEGALAMVNNYPNILRDWGLDSSENQLHFAALKSILPEGRVYKKVLVLGAGACRLSYDFHQAGLSEQIICCDINPLLLFSARLILDGNTLDVPYVTYVPKDLASIGGKMSCRAPEPVKPGMSLVFCDAYHLPFADQQFDAVITPWLIDILPYPLENLLQSVRRVLKVGGDWLNTGSLNMQLPDPSHNYFWPEIVELAEQFGFRIQGMSQTEVPYLYFAGSSHERRELVTSFRAQL